MNAEYEVLVIGGGIHGAGVAQAAAAAGYHTLLLEKNNWATGTSSKSSKLIHGGLRYLQSGDFRLVWECLRERELLLRNAPQLVQRRSFYLPVYRGSNYRSWQIALGLSLYSLLAGCGQHSRFKRLNKAFWRRQLPGLTQVGLQQVFCYQAAQTDDRLLTQAVAHSARRLGARTLTHSAFINPQRYNHGYRVVYQQAQQESEITARVLVNAAGPWVTEINRRIYPTPPELPVTLVQGTHLVIKGNISEQGYYLEAPSDHRAVFALPWGQNTLLGTTETLFEGNPDEVSPLAAEEHYLLAVLNHYFPAYSPQVLERFAGLRVLPESKYPFFTRSRETQLLCDKPRQPGVITIYGGKLTSYRATAAKVVRLLARNIATRKPIADTRKLTLNPAPDEPAVHDATAETGH